MSDRDIRNWNQRLKDQVFLNWDNYRRHRIDLGAARAAEFLGITGEFITVEKVSSQSAQASIRMNLNTNPPLDLGLGVKIDTVFKEIYITNTAQTGEWMDLIIGINFRYERDLAATAAGGIAEVQPVVILTHANPNTNVAAGAQICNAALIKADVNNTQTAWIDFGTAAVQNACIPLDPGETITVTISNLNRINANFEVGGEIVFIAYE